MAAGFHFSQAAVTRLYSLEQKPAAIPALSWVGTDTPALHDAIVWSWIKKKKKIEQNQN